MIKKLILMALLKLAGLIDKISGKLGGSVFGTSQNGSYIKQNSYSQQHPTPKQSKQRTALYPTTQKWRDLTIAEQQLWIDETPNYPYTNNVGDAVFYTGFQLFNLLNTNRALIGLPTLSVPATFQAPVVPVIDFLTFNATVMDIFYNNGSPNNTYKIYATRPLVNKKTPQPNDYHYIGYVAVAINSGTLDILNLYNSVLGNPPIDALVFVKLKAVNRNTGQPSNFTNQVYLFKK